MLWDTPLHRMLSKKLQTAMFVQFSIPFLSVCSKLVGEKWV